MSAFVYIIYEEFLDDDTCIRASRCIPKQEIDQEGVQILANLAQVQAQVEEKKSGILQQRGKTSVR